jgi:very-short-patch-repair endonuclease
VRVLPEGRELVMVAGLPATSLARTLADLAGRTRPAELNELVDRAIRSRRSDSARSGLVRALREAAAHRHGAAALRAAIAPWVSDGRGARHMQSVLEAQVLRLLIAAGVPAPVRQHRVVLPSGHEYFLDFAWPGAGVALEVDGFAYHSDRSTFERDRLRGNMLLAAGWQILHTTAGESRRTPQALVGVVLEALRTRGALL